FLEPKSAQIAFDPGKTFFLSGKQDPLPPRRIFHNHDWFGANDSRSFPVTNRTRFVLEFSPWDAAHPNRYKPFSLGIEGLSVADSRVTVSPIAFKSITIVRPEFRLPY